MGPVDLPGYPRVSIVTLADRRAARALDGRPIWLTDGMTWGDGLVPPFYGDHPNGGPGVALKLAPDSTVRLPRSTRDEFCPYGVLHVSFAAGDGGLIMSIDVVGEASPQILRRPPARPPWTVMVLGAAATSALAWSVVVAVRRALRQRRSYLFAPGRCAGCGYDLRATAERCPECGATAPRVVRYIPPPGRG